MSDAFSDCPTFGTLPEVCTYIFTSFVEEETLTAYSEALIISV